MEMEQRQAQETDSAKPPYPWRVPVIYALLGGPLGAWLMVCYLWLQNGWISCNRIAEFIADMREATLWGYVFGGLPMLLAGLLAGRLRLRRTAKNMACMSAVGAAAVCLQFAAIHLGRPHNWSGVFLMRLAAITVCGALASLLLSVFLPSRRNSLQVEH